MNSSPEEDETNAIPEEYYELGYNDALGNFEDIRKLIGEIGEKLAVDILQAKYGSNATVTLHNSDYYKQQGYDITVTAPGMETLYYEVKTRTATRQLRYTLNFSRSQARNLREKNYHVLLVIINGKRQLLESIDFDDLFDRFNGGCFFRDDGYRIQTK